MSLSYCVLHKECHGCHEGLMYSARFYDQPVDPNTPFRLLPSYVGSCALRILDKNVHITRMVFMEAEVNGIKVGFRFEKHHQLDLLLRLLESESSVETASWERHKADQEICRTVNIIERIRFLTRHNAQELL
jgi:hypothetical protein